MTNRMQWRWQGSVAWCGVLACCGLMGSASFASAQSSKQERECDEIVIEDGQEVCIRTKVVRRVVKKKPSKKSAARASKRSKARATSRRKEAAARERFEDEEVVGDGPFLVVDPTAFEIARRSALREGVAQPADGANRSSSSARAQGGEAAWRGARDGGAVSASQGSSREGGVARGSDKESEVIDATLSREETSAHTRALRVEALTDVPLMIGAGLLYETDSRLRLRTSLGVMPKGYLRLSNALVERANEEYPEEARLLVERALDESIVWRSQIGWRPFEQAGFYTHVGYTMLGLRGGASGEELIAAAESFDEDQGELMRQMNPSTVDMASRLHLVDVELGWDFALGEKANLRFGAGWAYTFHSRTRVEAEFEEGTGMEEEEIAFFEEVSGKYLDAIYRRFVHPPSVSVAFGLKF